MVFHSKVVSHSDLGLEIKSCLFKKCFIGAKCKDFDVEIELKAIQKNKKKIFIEKIQHKWLISTYCLRKPRALFTPVLRIFNSISDVGFPLRQELGISLQQYIQYYFK